MTEAALELSDREDETLALAIAEAVAKSVRKRDRRDWSDADTAALAVDMKAVIQWQKYLLPNSLSCAAENARRARLHATEREAIRRATVFEAAARELCDNAIGDAACLAGIHGPAASEKRDVTAGDRTDSFATHDGLVRLARGERAIAEAAASEIRKRAQKWARVLVAWVAEVLWRHGVNPSASKNRYPKLSANKKGTPVPTGHLVTACAMLLGQRPSEAHWVVRMAETLRAERRTVPDSLPDPWRSLQPNLQRAERACR